MKPARAIRPGLAVSLAFVAFLAVGPGAVFADCAEPLPIDKAVATADVVFVGTVTNVTNNARWAEVTVAEVWRGPDQPSTLVIRGGPAGNTMSSVDRNFEVGMTYLFVPYIDTSTGTLADNICTSTTPWNAGLDALRPAAVRQPLGATPVDSGFDLEPLVPFALAGLVALGLLGVGLLARGRQEF